MWETSLATEILQFSRFKTSIIGDLWCRSLLWVLRRVYRGLLWWFRSHLSLMAWLCHGDLGVGTFQLHQEIQLENSIWKCQKVHVTMKYYTNMKLIIYWKWTIFHPIVESKRYCFSSALTYWSSVTEAINSIRYVDVDIPDHRVLWKAGMSWSSVHPRCRWGSVGGSTFRFGDDRPEI